jgi:hypothetical protein
MAEVEPIPSKDTVQFGFIDLWIEIELCIGRETFGGVGGEAGASHGAESVQHGFSSFLLHSGPWIQETRLGFLPDRKNRNIGSDEHRLPHSHGSVQHLSPIW